MNRIVMDTLEEDEEEVDNETHIDIIETDGFETKLKITNFEELKDNSEITLKTEIKENENNSLVSKDTSENYSDTEKKDNIDIIDCDKLVEKLDEQNLEDTENAQQSEEHTEVANHVLKDFVKEEHVRDGEIQTNEAHNTNEESKEAIQLTIDDWS